MLKALLAQVLPRGRKKSPLSAGMPATPLERAAALVAQREWDAAARLTGEILAAQPDNVEALLLHAKSCRARQLLEQAQHVYRRALALDPRRADAWLDLGVCHYRAGDYFWARVYYRLAKTLAPGHADVWNELAVVDIALGNFGAAEEALERAVALNPALPEAWNNLGLVLVRRGQVAAARRHFLRAIFLRPEYYMAHCNAGLAAKDLELLDEAERLLRRAVQIDPAPAPGWLNFGAVLQDAGKLDEALAALESAHSRSPDAPDVLAALSALWLRRGDAARAEALAAQALAAEPQYAQARLALAHAQLAQGNFAAGWPNYQARLPAGAVTTRRYAAPAWQGEPLAGKSVLVWGEQGLGDEIMFAGCLPQLMAVAERCTLDCSPRLRRLFARSFPQAGLADGNAEGIDHALPIGSLPLVFRRSVEDFPRHEGYLRADPARIAAWRTRLGGLGDGLKVGIAWRGGLLRTGRNERSLHLARLRQLLQAPNVKWVSLQHGETSAEIAAVRDAHGISVASWQEALGDLDETAALIMALDLVVTVCSTVVHLSGALGRRTWVLTPKAPAWRYQQAGAGMPWYPSVALYRQAVQGDWDEPVRAMQAELRCLAG